MKKSIYLILGFTLLVNSNLRSQGTALTVGYILNQIEDKANSILENAEYRLNNVVYNAANNVTYSIKTFKTQYEELLGKTVDEFDALQNNAFTNLQKNVDNVFDNIDSKLMPNVEQSVNQLGSFMSNLPFAKNTSFISHFNAPIITDQATEDIILDIKGVNLNSNLNYANMNGIELRLRPKTDNLIQLILSSNSLSNLGETDCSEIQDLEIVTHYIKPKPFWKFWGKDEVIKKVYNPIVTVVPNEIGSVKIFYNRKEEKEVSNPRTEKLKLEIENSTLGGKHGNVSNNFVPNDGYYFKVNEEPSFRKTAEWKPCSSGHQRWEISNHTTTGFTVKLHGRTNRKFKDGRCIYEVELKFNEYKVGQETTEKTQEDILYHNKDIAFNLDSDKDEFKYAEIIYCDGSKTVMNSEKIYDELIKINIDKNAITLQPAR